ncbi:SDR family oxidoreductase [Paenibacillus campi]|uniref:SDR family oxidoreductase n=1 Tax=Paenibacillus campi TaxID=3106031 RepID=UPI002AFDD223|nr:SDR family NAD(P)-dependent oxidoreductase [Paenibacillus sp. SGZ-1014]
MNMSGNTILITGGATGIGLAFAERFIAAGNQVIICGRRESALQEAQAKLSGLEIRVCDLSIASERIALFDWVNEHRPDINVLVNNAGIQQRFHMLKADASRNWDYFSKEIETNVDAPIHLCMLFAPFLAQKEAATIINVTSGLAFTPFAIAPIYSATKAALHSFTMSLRHQLSDTAVEVIEVAPPAVNTDLGGANLHTHGEPLTEFADGIFAGLQAGKLEIGYGSSADRLRMSRDDIDKYTEQMYAASKHMV